MSRNTQLSSQGIYKLNVIKGLSFTTKLKKLFFLLLRKQTSKRLTSWKVTVAYGRSQHQRHRTYSFIHQVGFYYRTKNT